VAAVIWDPLAFSPTGACAEVNPASLAMRRDHHSEANYFQLANHASTSFLLWSFAYPYRC
jgi:hypothetical protein